MCAAQGLPAQLALEARMACGFGACFGCVVPTRAGATFACAWTDRSWPRTYWACRRMMIDFCGLELAHPVINASGTFDAIAARRAFGDELLERLPVRCLRLQDGHLAPRQGNPPPRLWETGAGLINSIGLPNKGLEGYLAEDLPSWPGSRCL